MTKNDIKTANVSSSNERDEISLSYISSSEDDE